DELRLVQSILGRGCPTEITGHLQDAVHSKIVINLTNALDALLGRGARPLSNVAVYQQLLTQTLWEGVQVVRAVGYQSIASPACRHSGFCIWSQSCPVRWRGRCSNAG